MRGSSKNAMNVMAAEKPQASTSATLVQVAQDAHEPLRLEAEGGW